MADGKYNSVFDLSVALDHRERDASDLTRGDISAALERRMVELRAVSDGEFFAAVSGPHDTYEIS